jgi:hypothetical protein
VPQRSRRGAQGHHIAGDLAIPTSKLFPVTQPTLLQAGIRNSMENMTMVALSVYREAGRPATLAAHIHPLVDLTPSTVTFRFEVLVDDATLLQDMVSQHHMFCIGSQHSFWGRLESLDPCDSTHPELQLIKHRKPILLGSIAIEREHPSAQ